MSNLDVLWLNLSPSFKCFDRPLIHYLAQRTTIAQWEYCQTQDEPSSFEIALTLLHDYIKCCNHPLHLIGHGTSGLLGLLYAQRYPKRVRSLTLFSVGVQPAMDWQTYYYAHRRLLLCDRQKILMQMACDLFGCQPDSTIEALVKLLEQDLDRSLSLHNLFRQVNLPPIRVSVPLMVCGSVDDIVIDPNQLLSWQQSFSNEVSRLWICPGGRHFFHYPYFQRVGDELLKFWRSLPSYSNPHTILEPLKASA